MTERGNGGGGIKREWNKKKVGKQKQASPNPLEKVHKPAHAALALKIF